MLRLLKFLFTGSFHECQFVQIDQHKTSTYSSGYSSRPHTITHTYVSRCNCGKIVSKQVTV